MVVPKVTIDNNSVLFSKSRAAIKGYKPLEKPVMTPFAYTHMVLNVLYIHIATIFCW